MPNIELELSRQIVSFVQNLRMEDLEKKQISKDKIIIKITIQLILEVFLPLRSKVHLTMNQQINP